MHTAGQHHRGQRLPAIALAMAIVVPLLVVVSAAPASAAIASWNLKRIPVPANDVAYDAGRDVVLATVPTLHTSLGNELVELDPESGAIGRHVFVGSEPGPIALTDDGTTAYVGLWDVNRIVRVNLASFTVVQAFSTGSDSFFGPLYPEDLVAVPGRNDVVVASLMRYGASPRHGGVWVFDDGVVLPDHTPDHTGANRIEAGSATMVYGYNNETSEFGFRRISITATGAKTLDTGSSAITGYGTDIEYAGGVVYSTTGLAIDPATRQAVQSYGTGGVLEVTAANDRITFVDGTQVSVFNRTTGQPVESRSFSSLPVDAWSLVASATGFALASHDGVFLFGPSVDTSTAFVPPGPDSALGDVVYVKVPLRANGILYDDLRDRVYVSVRNDDPARANQVVALDPETGAVLDSVFVGSNPGPLALSGDRSRLHVGLSTVGRVAQLDAASLDIAGSFSLGNSSLSGALVAEDIEVRPGTTNTLAISLRNVGYSPRHEGVAIFENGTRLASSTPSHTGANRIEFTDANTLVGTNNETTGFQFYRMAVSATGVTVTSTTGYLFPGFGTEIDVTTGLVYASTGQVANPAVPELVGRYPFGGAMEAVPALGRTFITWRGGLEEYDQTRYRPVAAWDIDLGDNPFALEATAEGLATATASGVFLFTAATSFPWAQPVVAGLSPSSGTTAGGTSVTIYGSGFTAASSVTFGSHAATSFTVLSDSEITATAPAHAAGSVTVSVRAPGGTSGATAGATYTYAHEVPPMTSPPTTYTSILPTSPTPNETPPSSPQSPAPSEPAPSLPATNGASGYWMVGTDGNVYAFGSAAWLGNAPVGAHRAVDLEPTPSRNGYWVVDSAGHVYSFGDAPYFGGAPPLGVTETVTSLSATPTGGGYWLFTSKGRVLTFGDATWYGDMSGTVLNGPVLDSIPTASGKGYYMVGSDGGIFTFGDAVFRGSMGHTTLNAPVQALVPDADGQGYWLVASDGGIFAFDAPFYGSMGGTKLNRPITGMVGGRGGYLMVGEDGGIFTFGSAQFHGSLGATPPANPVTSVAAR